MHTELEIVTKRLGPHAIVHPDRKTQPNSNMRTNSEKSIHGKTLHKNFVVVGAILWKVANEGKNNIFGWGFVP